MALFPNSLKKFIIWLSGMKLVNFEAKLQRQGFFFNLPKECKKNWNDFSMNSESLV